MAAIAGDQMVTVGGCRILYAPATTPPLTKRTCPVDNLTRDEARTRAQLVTAVSYEVDLDLSTAGDTFASRTTVRFECTDPGSATFIDLAAEQVEKVVLNGRDITGSAVGKRIELVDLAGTNELEVHAHCGYQTTGVGMHRFTDPVDGKVYLHTQFEPFDAHQVFACFDQPDLKGTFTLLVTAPAEWEVVSNAPVVARPEGGAAGRWEFAPTLPVSTYITAVVAGPYHCERTTHRGIDLGLYCRASLAKHLDSEEMFTTTRQGFDFFTDVFGFPYPFGKYDQLFVPEFNWGAMENPGCVTFSESYVFRSKVTEASREQRANTTLHEMAHMWFGDLVTMRWWDDLWLNESFATYMATHALSAATRFTSSWATFADEDKSWAIAQDQLPSTHPISADIVDTEAVRTHFDGITYAKGASVLRQLVAWVGEDAFFSGLRRYFRRHAFANASLNDFLGALEQASGRDLGTWAQQWLQTAGVSTMRAELPDGDELDGTVIVQEATETHPTLRDHRLGVGLYDLAGDDLKRRRFVDLDVTGQRTEVASLSGKRPDLLLLNDGDLAFTKVRLDEPSVATLERHLSKLDDPLARSVAWGALWDMTRDAELAARVFVSTVAQHAGQEREIGVLQTLMARATAAYQRYGDPVNRRPARAALREAAIGGIAAAAPGSDEQLVWVRARANHADNDTEYDWVEGLLSGDMQIDGLEVDTDLRWALVTALAESGRLDASGIDAERERDNTDIGARRAATARAARPTADAKREAWDAVVGDASLTLAMRRALMAGLYRFSQEELASDYVNAYAEVLPSLWENRGIEESLEMTSGLYPSVVVHDRVVQMADELLGGDLPAPARRVVSEQQDSTKRALRARAADLRATSD